MALLDVGSGNKRLEQELRKVGYKGFYKDCDTDTRYLHDFQNIVDVVGKYDVITMFDLIEHINFEEAYNLFKPSSTLKAESLFQLLTQLILIVFGKQI